MTNLGNELFIDFIIYLLFKIEFKKIEYWKKTNFENFKFDLKFVQS